MKLVIGLGNNEPLYSGTRHNIGKDFLNYIVSKHFAELEWKDETKLKSQLIKKNDLIFCKPQLQMNLSGKSVGLVSNYFKVTMQNIFVIYDELDIVVGDFKIHKGRGSKIHNGMLSLYNNGLDRKEIWHVRVGVRSKSLGQSVQKSGVDPSKYVLEKFSKSEKELIPPMFEKMSSRLFKELGSE